MYIFNLFYSLPSYNPNFLICLCFNMVSIRSQKKAWAMPRSVSFTGLIQNFRRASPPLSYAESPPGTEYSQMAANLVSPVFLQKLALDASLMVKFLFRWRQRGLIHI